jgi:hypothetical protein
MARRSDQNPTRQCGTRFLTKKCYEPAQSACPALTRRVLITQSTTVAYYNLWVINQQLRNAALKQSSGSITTDFDTFSLPFARVEYNS